MQKITPFLWFDGKAEEAVNYYTSLFPDSKIVLLKKWGEGSPFPKDWIMQSIFELNGQQFYAFDAGPQFKFTEAISFFISCKDQAEIDHYYDNLSSGGQEQQCGWVKDKFGVSWQVVPSQLGEWMSDPNVMQALMKMKKIIIKNLANAANESEK